MTALPGCQGCAVSPPASPLEQPTDESAEPTTSADDTAQETTSGDSDKAPASHPPIERHASSSPNGAESTSNDLDGSAENPPSSDSSDPSEATASQRGRGKKKPSDLNSTIKQINTLRQDAKRARDQGDLGKAFQDVTKAWDAARSHPNDAQCRALAEQLAKEMQELAPNANDRYRTRSTHSRLIVK